MPVLINVVRTHWFLHRPCVRRYPRFRSLHRCWNWTTFTFHPWFHLVCFLGSVLLVESVKKQDPFLLLLLSSREQKTADWQSNLQQDFYVFTTSKGSPDNGWFWDRLFPALGNIQTMPSFAIASFCRGWIAYLDSRPRIHVTKNLLTVG